MMEQISSSSIVVHPALVDRISLTPYRPSLDASMEYSSLCKSMHHLYHSQIQLFGAIPSGLLVKYGKK